MKGFVRVLVFGMAFLGMLLAGGLIVFLSLTTAKGKWREIQRGVVLTPEEKLILERESARKPEEPKLEGHAAGPKHDPDMEKVIENIADHIQRSQVKEITEDLKSRRAQLNERATALARRESEIELARADLVRLGEEVASRERRLEETRLRDADERRRLLADLEMQQAWILQVKQLERDNLKQTALRAEVLKPDEAWRQLRHLGAERIAIVVGLLEGKKAAKLMVEAFKDQDFPLLGHDVQEKLLRVDAEGRVADDPGRLAALLGWLRPEEALPQLSGRTEEEVAAILSRIRDSKKTGQILEAMRNAKDPREPGIQKILAGEQKNLKKT